MSTDNGDSLLCHLHCSNDDVNTSPSLLASLVAGIENTGEVTESWKAVCTFRMVHDEVNLPDGKKSVTKSDMIHGWDGGRVDWKLNKLLEQMDDGGERVRRARDKLVANTVLTS